MDTLDTLVTAHLADRLLAPERLTALLASLASRRAVKAAAVNKRLGLLERDAHESNDRLRRLYSLVEDGVAEVDHILKDRIVVDDGVIRIIGRKDVPERAVAAAGGLVPPVRSFVCAARDIGDGTYRTHG